MQLPLVLKAPILVTDTIKLPLNTFETVQNRFKNINHQSLFLLFTISYFQDSNLRFTELLSLHCNGFDLLRKLIVLLKTCWIIELFSWFLLCLKTCADMEIIWHAFKSSCTVDSRSLSQMRLISQFNYNEQSCKTLYKEILSVSFQ